MTAVLNSEAPECRHNFTQKQGTTRKAMRSTLLRR